MAKPSTSSSGESAKRAPRKRGWRIALAVLLCSIAIQSITITLPIRGRVVDETSGQPVPRAAVAAFWQLNAYSFERLPGGTVRMAETLTDEDGTFRLPMAFMIHLPLIPFSPLARSDSDMPVLMIVADGYYPRGANNSVPRIEAAQPPSGFLSLRVSSLQGAVLRLTPLTQVLTRQQRSEYANNLSWFRGEITQATGSCARNLSCKSHSLAEMRAALERGLARAKSR